MFEGSVSKVPGRSGAVVGVLAAAFYAWHGLTLSHYDAKAHLVVARRVLDSLTPDTRKSAQSGCLFPTC